MNADSYKNLLTQTVETGRPTYRLDDPRLFELITTQHIAPQPGPKLTTNAAQSYLGTQNAR
jgi:cytochrome o ubiquinol oxidase subunit 2